MIRGRIANETYEVAVVRILDDIARPTKVSISTRIYHDLLISGDDAAEIINRVHGEFGTLWRGLEFDNYFAAAAESLFERFMLLIGRATKGPMTVEHLVHVIEAGEWFDLETG